MVDVDNVHVDYAVRFPMHTLLLADGFRTCLVGHDKDCTLMCGALHLLGQLFLYRMLD